MPNKNKKSSKGSRVNHNTARQDNLAYALSKKNLIYKWIMQNSTIADVADKLKVSRSWLFKAFAENSELNEIKEAAFADRRDKIEANLYERASGTYKVTIRRSKTSSVTREETDSQGIVTKVRTSPVTEHTEETIEHVGDYDMKAIAMILKMNGKRAEMPDGLVDTITDEDAFEFVDVENIDDIE